MKYVKYAVISAFLAIICLLSGCSGGDVDKINSYIERTKDFKGGSIDYENRKYESEFWELEFEFGEDWVIHTPEQMEYIASSSHDSIVNAGFLALKDENADEKYIEAYKKSVRIVPEFAADCYSGDVLFGTALGFSITKYSGDTESVENVIPGMRAVMNEGTAKDCSVVINGETYVGVEGVMARYNEDTNAVIYAREKDGIYFVIMIGYYDDGSAVDEFLKMIE